MANAPAPKRWVETLALFSDASRLRVLRALDGYELAVGEIAKALQIPQSTASRLIKPLFEAGLVTRRVEGTTSLYRAGIEQAEAPVKALWELTRDSLAGSKQTGEDEARLRAVIAKRPVDSLGFFGRVGGEWDAIRRELFGAAGGLDALLHLLDPSWVVADIGCGTGEVAERLAGAVGRVIAIDREAAMIAAAKKRLGSRRSIEFRRGDVHELPARDGEFDAAIAMLLFHHLDEPRRALREIARCTKPGGRILVVDMVSHERTTYKTTMGHRHLGFSETEAREWARAAGVTLRSWSTLAPQVDVRGPQLFAAVFANSLS